MHPFVPTRHRRPALVLALLLAAGGLLPPRAALAADDAPHAVMAAQDQGWPRRYQSGEHELIIYQPQVESWENFGRMVFTAAVGVGPRGQSSKHYGVLRVSADATVAFEERLVVLTNPKIESLTMSDLGPAEEARIRSAIAGVLAPDRAITIALERVLADLDPATLPVCTVEVSVAPPPVFYSDQPAALVVFFGEPKFAPIAGTELQYAVNTNWDVLLEPATSTYYLLYDQGWLSTRDLVNGPWLPVASVPRSLYRLPGSADWRDVKQFVPGTPLAVAPRMFVMTQPCELIVTEGAPAFKEIPGTRLSLVANTDNDIVYDTESHTYFALFAGRWFKAPELTGPWTAAGPLPPSFVTIPVDSDAGDLLASIPGTPQATEAILLASIPQRAIVNRADISLTVTFAGEPKFEVIAGTPVRWAINTPFRVFAVDNAYYACDNGVWFCSTSPITGWTVCDRVPDAIYLIPPTHPAYHVTFVRVFDHTPATVTFGFSAGYFGVHVSTGGCVVFGLGRVIDAAIGDDPWWTWHYPRYWFSYGVGARYVPATGVYVSAARYAGPYGGAGHFAVYNPATGAWARGGEIHGPRRDAEWYRAYNPVTGNGIAVSHGTTPYGSWGKGAATNGDDWVRGGYYAGNNVSVGAAQNSQGGKIVKVEGRYGNGVTVGRTADGDFFAGKDGNVYKRTDGGGFEPVNRRRDVNAPGPMGGPGAGVTRTTGSQPAQTDLQRRAAARDRGNDEAQRNRPSAGGQPGNSTTPSPSSGSGSRRRRGGR